MIVEGFQWFEGFTVEDGECPWPKVQPAEEHRISALLGPDGHPLKVPFARYKLGFDLTPKKPTT